ncbi:MAG: glycosyltransferase family 2 protein [Candidatus Aenigmarchaeota archaeon]|nr:glycosyltransferase family 2 protein [Candidatus Aenigmarchaeota archaeon]
MVFSSIGYFGIFDIVQLFCYFIMVYCSILWFVVFIKNHYKFFVDKPIKNYPSVTFLIPAYNEKKFLSKCLNSVLNLDYPKNKLKIICINDGSTDETSEICKNIKNRRVLVINKKNTGKADSLNIALKLVDSEFVVSMDADSFPRKNYLKKIIGHFDDKDIAAISPAMKINKPQTIMQQIQWVEYIFSIYLRKLFAIFDCQYVLPGPGSIYRTDKLKEIGGWDKNSLVEDTELAFRMYEKGYKIENCINAYVDTEAPEKFKELFQQRVRWYRGYLQTTFQYKHLLGNSKYGNLGLFILPINFVWIFILGFLFFMPLYMLLKDFSEYLHILSLVGFEWSPLIFNFDILYVSSYNYFFVLFFLMGITTILLSLYTSGEKIDFKTKKIFYFGYLFIYPFLYSTFWIAAVVYEIFKIDNKW